MLGLVYFWFGCAVFYRVIHVVQSAVLPPCVVRLSVRLSVSHKYLSFVNSTMRRLDASFYLTPCINVFWLIELSIDVRYELFFTTTTRQGRFYGGQGARPQWKMWPPVAPHFGPASLVFHLNRPVISLIQLHIVAPGPPSWNFGPPLAPIGFTVKILWRYKSVYVIQLYSGGVFNNRECSRSTGLNHALLVVGYGILGDEEYWLLRNRSVWFYRSI